MCGSDQNETCNEITRFPVQKPESWDIPFERIWSNGDLRLDVTHFNPKMDICLKRLHDSPYPCKPLRELADLSLPNRFERIWASGPRHGLPYLNATELMSLFSRGIPAKERWLSRASRVNMDSLIICQDWLLLTCSGTIGRVFHVPERLSGWVATHDLVRIKAKRNMSGYLYAWMMTEEAQVQILGHTHGGQIEHVTGEQVGSMLVPILPEDKRRSLNNSVLSALEAREQALDRTMKLGRILS